MFSLRVRDRVMELMRIKHELLMEELEKRGVFDMPRNTIAEKCERAAEAFKAYIEAEKRWKKIVAKEPFEVKVELARLMMSLQSLVR